MRIVRSATLLFLAILWLPTSLCHAEDVQTISLTILCDNYVQDERFAAEWGFSCVVLGLERTILFDTGGSEGSIRANLALVGIEPGEIDAIAFSHAHSDHTAGLPFLYPLPASAQVFVPSWFPSSWWRAIEAQAATTVVPAEATAICPDAFLTGPVFGAAVEEALCLRTRVGLVVITGCAHPGIVRMVETARTLFPGEPIALVIGGFHLLQESEASIRAMALSLLDLGVARVAPTHCSGDLARTVFREVFGGNSIEAGAGLTVSL